MNVKFVEIILMLVICVIFAKCAKKETNNERHISVKHHRGIFSLLAPKAARESRQFEFGVPPRSWPIRRPVRRSSPERLPGFRQNRARPVPQRPMIQQRQAPEVPKFRLANASPSKPSRVAEDFPRPAPGRFTNFNFGALDMSDARDVEEREVHENPESGEVKLLPPEIPSTWKIVPMLLGTGPVKKQEDPETLKLAEPETGRPEIQADEPMEPPVVLPHEADGSKDEDNMRESVEVYEDQEDTSEESSSPTTTSTTTRTTLSTTPRVTTPVDVKSLLRNAESLSLSELLQEKGMSLSDLLKDGSKLLGQLGTSLHRKPVADNSMLTTVVASSTTESTTESTNESFRVTTPRTIPDIKPMRFRELLLARNQTLSDVMNNGKQIQSSPATTFDEQWVSNDPPATTTTITTTVSDQENPLEATETKAGATNTTVYSTTTTATSTTTATTTTKSKQPYVPEQHPSILSEDSDETSAPPETTVGSVTTTASATTTTTKSKQPYSPSESTGEYSVQTVLDGDEGSNQTRIKSPSRLGNSRPIATSRLTPAPPRKERPRYYYNWSTSDLAAVTEPATNDDNETTTTETTTTTVRPTQKTVKETEVTTEQLPLSIHSIIVASSVLGGLFVVVFLIILVVVGKNQKSRITLRHAALMFGRKKTSQLPAPSNCSSELASPVTNTRRGYAKLPYRKGSLWGTLRRTLRNTES